MIDDNALEIAVLARRLLRRVGKSDADLSDQTIRELWGLVEAVQSPEVPRIQGVHLGIEIVLAGGPAVVHWDGVVRFDHVQEIALGYGDRCRIHVAPWNESSTFKESEG